jgi:hypothetical protein
MQRASASGMIVRRIGANASPAVGFELVEIAAIASTMAV